MVENNNTTKILQSFLDANSKWKVISSDNQKFLSSHDQLMREYEFSSDKNTYEFAYAILVQAEEHNHHPTLIAEWHKVTLVWSTHSHRTVTELDIEMAKLSDEIYQKIVKR
ncbi:MAG: 4a-hydroxytetrahydrobiopterin dehydratase [Anaerolineaceae bacterium]|nr:4a-hydroxytetrahydrobiopterin dehydratase [Anaerolineaceae bacterium]